ncbi:hypothetical protein [Mesorhizobium sp. M0965]|uniref:hypothetical protein n=1 Tax=Mesorhizobium sp. M0965 TaxID=2957036 RepID=UPI00333A4336
MVALSNQDQLFLNVGKCLTAWNMVEERVLNLLEYAHQRGGFGIAEINVGYWAVVSFEARLKWCNAVVSFRTRGDNYKELAETWNALNNKLIAKARKRAEIAHGSVINVKPSSASEFTSHFVPFYHKRRLEHTLQPHDTYVQSDFIKDTTTLRVSEIKARTQSFKQVRQSLAEFQTAWIKKDIETGFLE